ncbi:T9SS type A sorting domain-containing protein [Desulfosarcina sp.]|nr:T9SS type A sorting domain-containing protein [Desulfosarcina sp.]
MEGERSAHYSGADARFLSFEDAGFLTTEAVTERMCRMIRELQPDIVITHASNGEYGHGAHIKTSNGVTQAVIDAADPTKYPEQLEEGLDVWDTPKFYRQNANYNGWESSESITVTIPGVVGPIDGLGGKTIRDYAVYAMEQSHYTATAVFGGFDWGNTYPVPNEHSLHLARLAGGATPPATENSILDGLSAEQLQTYTYIKDWILLGPFDGEVDEDFTSGEADLDPNEGDIENEKVWTAYALESYNLGTEGEIDNQGMEIRSNIDMKEFFGYRPLFTSDKVAYAYRSYNVTNDTTILLGLTAHDYYKVYVNGDLVRMRDAVSSYIRWDYEDRIPVDLAAGDNRIMIKVASRSSMSGSPWNTVPEYDNTPYLVANSNARAWSFSLKANEMNNVAVSDVTFNVTSEGLPLEDAIVSFSSTMKNTDATGTAMFNYVFNKTEAVEYVVEKEGFEPVAGTVIVDGDKSVDVEMGDASISEYALATFEMYPNPATDQLSVSFKTSGENEIKIYDLTGIEVYTNITRETNFSIDLSRLSTGVYMVKVSDHVQKLVIK